ncbi:MAG: tRNA (adenosine(37)-N6)-threonylcarbamoyltransferase complex ATPase subunit type 1 TsaE [Eubacteriales bacterium]
MTYISHSPEDTRKIAYDIASSLGGIRFIALYGGLGAGKTAFVGGFVSRLCPDSRVISPTYAIMNQYGTERCPVCHFDMYRIKNDDDLVSAGFYELPDDAVVITEWSENIPYALPEEYLEVRIERSGDENTRVITVLPHKKDNKRTT